MASELHESIARTRVLLRDVRSKLWMAAWNADGSDAANLAHVATEAEHAEDALFTVLNSAHAHFDDDDAREVMFRDG